MVGHEKGKPAIQLRVSQPDKEKTGKQGGQYVDEAN